MRLKLLHGCFFLTGRVMSYKLGKARHSSFTFSLSNSIQALLSLLIPDSWDIDMDQWNVSKPTIGPGSHASQVVAACQKGDWNVVEEMLQSKTFSQHSDVEDEFPIAWPLAQHLDDSDWAAAMKLILKYDPGILLARDRDGRTALSCAAEYTQIRSMQRLLQTKLIPKYDMVEVLLWVGGAGVKFDPVSFVSFDRVIRLLIENGVDLSSRHEGAIPLAHAVQLGSTNVVKGFCRNSSSLVPEAFTSPDDEGRSPLSIAVFNRHYWAIDMLLNTGHYYNDHDQHGRTPLYWLLQSESGETQKKKVANILIWKQAHDRSRGDNPQSFEKGDMYVDPETLNQYHKNDGLTLLSHASRGNEGEFIRTILKIRGIQVDAPNRDGTTSLQVALVENKTEAAKALMEADKSTFKKLIDDNDIDLLQRLLELGYDVNQEVDKGRPLLHYVLRKTSPDAAEKLLQVILDPERGDELQSIDLRDGQGKTALELARGHLQLMRLLLSDGADLGRLTMQKDVWFTMNARHTASQSHTLAGTESGLLVRRGENGGIKFEFRELDTVMPFPCCPDDERIDSKASILCVVDPCSMPQL